MAHKKKNDKINGWLVLDKPTGVTSTQMVGKARRSLKAQKVGHSGTLDPLATGILPLAFGEATKTIPYVVAGRKSYVFSVRWGTETDSLDRDGKVTARCSKRPCRADILSILPHFLGEQDQIPPRFSALKVEGRRAYDLARAAQDFELKARKVRIDRLALLSIDSDDQASFEVDCGKGTYVRSLARDIAWALGTFGHIVTLRRTRVGPFDLKNTISLETLESFGHSLAAGGGPQGALLPVGAALDDISALALSEEGEAVSLRHGRALPLDRQRLSPRGPWGLFREAGARCEALVALWKGCPVALCRVEDGLVKPFRVLNL